MQAPAAALQHEDMNASNPAADPRELRSFIDRGGQVRLVNDLRTGRLEGLAFRPPGAWGWEEFPLESPAAGFARTTAVNVARQQLAQALPGIDPATAMDRLAQDAGRLTPLAVAAKLASIAGQALAHHLGLSPAAPAVGAALESAVRAMPFPASASAKGMDAFTDGVVALDLRDGQLTPTVEGFAVSKAFPEITRPTASPGDIETVHEFQRSQREAAASGAPPAPGITGQFLPSRMFRREPSRGDLPRPGEPLPSPRQEPDAPPGPARRRPPGPPRPDDF